MFCLWLSTHLPEGFEEPQVYISPGSSLYLDTVSPADEAEIACHVLLTAVSRLRVLWESEFIPALDKPSLSSTYELQLRFINNQDGVGLSFHGFEHFTLLIICGELCRAHQPCSFLCSGQSMRYSNCNQLTYVGLHVSNFFILLNRGLFISLWRENYLCSHFSISSSTSTSVSVSTFISILSSISIDLKMLVFYPMCIFVKNQVL